MTTGLLTKRIEKLKYDDDAPRDYIGASSIGDSCLRKIWYQFTKAQSDPIPARTRRIWEMGHLLEDYAIHLLKRTGIAFEDYQVELCDSELPYFRGHFDGLMVKPRAILEVKTAKSSSFNVFVKHGLLKWSPEYYAQIQSYMGMSGILNAYILVMNKDTCSFHDEKIAFDAVYYATLKEKARLIYNAKTTPPRVHASPLWFECKMCQFNKICHNTKEKNE